MFQSVGEYAKAEEYLHKALTIDTEIGDRTRRSVMLRTKPRKCVSICRRNMPRLKNIFIKHLPSRQKLATEHGEATCYGNLGNVFQSVGEYAKAEEYIHKALTINTEIGDRNGEATCYLET